MNQFALWFLCNGYRDVNVRKEDLPTGAIYPKMRFYLKPLQVIDRVQGLGFGNPHRL